MFIKILFLISARGNRWRCRSVLGPRGALCQTEKGVLRQDKAGTPEGVHPTAHRPPGLGGQSPASRILFHL